MVAAGCKTAKPVAAGEYKEDVSMYRIKYTLPDPENQAAFQERFPDRKPEDKPVQLPQTLSSSPLDITEQVNQRSVAMARRNTEFTKMQGFKIQVFSGGRRAEAEKVFASVSQLMKAEIMYEQPNYKVKVGNFINKLDAHKTLVQLRPEYPQAIIIPDVVQLNLESYLAD